MKYKLVQVPQRNTEGKVNSAPAPNRSPREGSVQRVPGTEAACVPEGQRGYAELTGSVYSRPELCLEILALLTTSLATDG